MNISGGDGGQDFSLKKKTDWFLMPFSGTDMVISFILLQEKFSYNVLLKYWIFVIYIAQRYREQFKLQ